MGAGAAAVTGRNSGGPSPAMRGGGAGVPAAGARADPRGYGNVSPGGNAGPSSGASGERVAFLWHLS